MGAGDADWRPPEITIILGGCLRPLTRVSISISISISTSSVLTF